MQARSSGRLLPSAFSILPSGRSLALGLASSMATLIVACTSDQATAPAGPGRLSRVSAVSASGCCWTTKAAIPTRRMFLAAGVVNGVLYAVGGWSNGDHETWSRGDYVATVEAYDPATDMWETKASMPTARGELAVGVVNGVLYAIGGRRGDPDQAVFATVEAYDPATDGWTTKAPMPTGRNGLATGVVHDILYAVGGYDGLGVFARLEAYDPAADSPSAPPVGECASPPAGAIWCDDFEVDRLSS